MNHQQARKVMVDGQIRPNGVTDTGIIAAMLDIPREKFMPEAWQALAYSDAAVLLPGGDTRALLTPTVLARLLQAAEIGPQDVVLDVGCGTGYSTALISRLAAFVVGLEVDEALGTIAGENLTAVEATSAVVVTGALAEGYAASAPYDVIVVEGAIEIQPDGLIAQLKEGGRLVTVVGSGGSAKATVYLKGEVGVSHRAVFDAAAHMLPGFERPATFVF